MGQLDTRAAISFITAAVRIPTEWSCPLMTSAALTKRWDKDRTHSSGKHYPEAQELWEAQLDETLAEHIARRVPGYQLRSLGELAIDLQRRFPEQLRDAGVNGGLLMATGKRRGILDYHRLRWLNSSFFRTSNAASDTSSVIAFKQAGLETYPPWREYALLPDSSRPESGTEYDQLAAIYDILGLLAQRRSLVSVTAQRILRKIVLPWGRCRFQSFKGETKEYLAVPVLTMLNRRMSAEFRRTMTLTLFMFPNEDDSAPALNTHDLAALCQQAVWHDTGPELPVIACTEGDEILEGPLAAYIDEERDHSNRLSDVFEAMFRTALTSLEVVPTTDYKPDSLRALVAMGRARSVVFGSVMHTTGDGTHPLFRGREKHHLEDELEQLLSVNAGREGREAMLGSRGFHIEPMRVTNPYEEDTRTSVLYNPMSRFMVQIIPRSIERFPTISLKFGVVWINLLATTVSSVKEMLRSYRYEVERHRNSVIPVDPMPSAPGGTRPSFDASLSMEVHNTTRRALDEIDVISSFDLVTPTYRAAHTRILEIEGVHQEREYLMRELETTANLLQSEESARISGAIATNTQSTDRLTQLVVLFSSISVMSLSNGLIVIIPDLAAPRPLMFSIIADVIIGLGAFILWRRLQRSRR